MRLKWIVFALLSAALIAACSGKEIPEVAPPTPVPSATPQPPPTLVPTLSTPLALLILPADMDRETSDLYQKTVYDLAQASGFRFQVRNEIKPEDLADPTLKVVIALPPDPGIASFAASAPTVQFLAVNIPDVAAGGNVSALAPSQQVEIPAFIAGYTLAMMTYEYRVGMLYPADDPNAQAAVVAFNNGARYYCGLCTGIYVDPAGYPTALGIPADEDPAKYGGYANILISDRKVGGMYIYSSLGSDDFLSLVGAQGVYLIGTTLPPHRPGGWLMTITPDTVKAIQKSWTQLIVGQGGINVQSPLGIEDADTGILTEAKLRLVRQVLDDLLTGRILPSNP
ncbi:MAG: hypothetical protein LC099_03420 [Anaerolineales bacterium]|nr:hypothetical protein [Anaerolineales bacterium]